MLILAWATIGCSDIAGSKPSVSAKRASDSDLRTANARRGDLTISAMGAGTVIIDNEIELSSDSEGELIELNVEVGEQVHSGDVVARIDEQRAHQTLLSAESQHQQAMQELIRAQFAHDHLIEGSSAADILAAQAAVQTARETLAQIEQGASDADIAAAEASLAVAQVAYDELVNGPESSALRNAEIAVAQAKNDLWSRQMSRDAQGTDKNRESLAYDQAQVSVLNAELAVERAEMALAALLEDATPAELAQGRARIAQAQQQLADMRDGASEGELANALGRLAQAQQALGDLVDGPSDEEAAISAAALAQAETAREQAELALREAQSVLETTTIVATHDATVMAVLYHVGDHVGANASVVTLADLSEPHLQVYVDELDLEMFQVGYEVEVLFDALPNQVFTGHVTRVEPQVTSAGGLSLVQGVVALDADSYAKTLNLFPGMNATVEVIGGRAEDAVLVPVEAVRQVGDDRYAVFVMENGKPQLRFVEVGLRTYTSAEILSGLDGNETVTTGIVEVQ
jgi:multidrug efflux pump subunit AcrA (membrane-fusion protein)